MHIYFPCPFTFIYFVCFQLAATEMTRHQRLEEAWGNISQNVIDEAVGQWKKRLRACVKVKGHHFEHLLK